MRRLRRHQIEGLTSDAATDGQGLVWDDTVEAYLPTTLSGGGGGGTLNDLTDVDTAGQTNGDVLTFDGTSWGPAASSGGGAGYRLDDIALDPTYGYDFSDADLPAGWTRQGYVDADDTGDGSRLVVTGKGPNNYYWITPPAGNFIATMKCWGMHSAAGGMFGILAIDGTGAGAGVTPYTGPEGVLTGRVSAGAYASSFSSLGTFVSDLAALNTRPTWYRLIKFGTKYAGSLSIDGDVWTPFTQAQTSAAAISRVGFGGFLGAATAAFKVDWFNVESII